MTVQVKIDVKPTPDGCVLVISTTGGIEIGTIDNLSSARLALAILTEQVRAEGTRTNERERKEANKGKLTTLQPSFSQ